MKERLIVLLLGVLPELCFAQRFQREGDLDDPDLVGENTTGIGDFGLLGLIFALPVVIYFYWILWRSYEDWKTRRKSGEKADRSEFFTDMAFSIIVYPVLAFFLSTPFMLAIKLFGGVDAAREYWFPVGLGCFLVLVFLRHT